MGSLFKIDARVLERREARHKRSKKLGRILFYCFLVGTTATLRLNPELIDNIAASSAETTTDRDDSAADQKTANQETFSSMPKDRVKVRRGIEVQE